MKKYIGVKEIEATQAWMCTWEGGSKQIIVGDENAEENDLFVASAEYAEFGYKVKYPNGYVSWSPKREFERAYQEITDFNITLEDDAELKPFQMRVVEESRELGQKIFDLSNFINSDKFESVNKEEQSRLLKQHDAMYAYLNILKERINNFEV